MIVDDGNSSELQAKTCDEEYFVRRGILTYADVTFPIVEESDLECDQVEAMDTSKLDTEMTVSTTREEIDSGHLAEENAFITPTCSMPWTDRRYSSPVEACAQCNCTAVGSDAVQARSSIRIIPEVALVDPGDTVCKYMCPSFLRAWCSSQLLVKVLLKTGHKDHRLASCMRADDFIEVL